MVLGKALTRLTQTWLDRAQGQKRTLNGRPPTWRKFLSGNEKEVVAGVGFEPTTFRL